MTKVVEVAVAIITKPNGEYLLASRPDGKGWAGWWEFPGGKVEVGELPEVALAREMQEELALSPTHIQPWIKRRYDYPATKDDVAKTVLLHFFFVRTWHGDPTPMEGQKLAWQHPQALTVSPVLPANAPIMHALSLPEQYAISNAAEMGEVDFLAALAKQLKQGLRLIQVREKQMTTEALSAFASEVKALSHAHDARVLINANIELAMKLGLDGVHLPSADLMKLSSKPSDLLVSASCHNVEQLQHAQGLGLDFVTLSPVTETLSHPDASGIGWESFAGMLGEVSIPVYALGGMTKASLPQALACGARGIAMQRAIWTATQP